MGNNSSETAVLHCFSSLHYHHHLLILLRLLLFLFLVLSSSSATQMKKRSSESTNYPLFHHPFINGSVVFAELGSDQGEELLMESEISRRFLAASREISYGALKPDKPACDSGRGESYSRNGNCLPPPSNPYDRGCFKYYKCRSDY